MHVHVPEQYLCVAQFFVLESLAKLYCIFSELKVLKNEVKEIKTELV